MTAAMQFEIFRAPHISLTSILRGGGDWRWQFCDLSGVVLAHGEGYRTRDACVAAIDALRRRASVANIIDLPRVAGSSSA